MESYITEKNVRVGKYMYSYTHIQIIFIRI